MNIITATEHARDHVSKCVGFYMFARTGLTVFVGDSVSAFVSVSLSLPLPLSLRLFCLSANN